MPTMAFESIRKVVEDFFGGASFTLVREGTSHREVEPGCNILERYIRTEPHAHRLILERSGLPFTATEKRIVDELVEAFLIIFARRNKSDDIAYFRTALLSSLLDVSVSRYLRFDRNRAFWSIQKLLQILKNLSFQRYEGTHATSGFIVYRNHTEEFNLACSRADCLRHAFKPGVSLSANFFRSPLTYRLVNGLGTYYACNINMQATGMLKFMNYGNRDTVERLCHRDTLFLINTLGEGAFAASITHHSELEVMTSPDNIFVWRKGNWSLFDPDVFRTFLHGHLEPNQLEALIMTIYTLSKLRMGTIILISRDDVLGSGELQKGSVGGKDVISQLIVGFFKRKTISSLKHSGELISILSSDGMTLFNEGGELVDAGIILNTCTTPGVATGGGRTTAAIAASFFGKVIKVSEDGPIELYENGACLYKFG